MAVKKLWTIGYENVGVPDFLAALTAAGVKTLVDVRDIANSRRAGFSKKALAASLSEAGVGYLHMKALGTPKAGREAVRRGDAATMRKIYEAKLAEPESALALDELGALARRGRVCIMCLEHDWRQCHRSMIAQRLAGDGLTTIHLAPGPEA